MFSSTLQRLRERTKKRNLLTSFSVLTGFFSKLSCTHPFTMEAIFSHDWQEDQSRYCSIKLITLKWLQCRPFICIHSERQSSRKQTLIAAEVQDALLMRYTRDRYTQLVSHILHAAWYTVQLTQCLLNWQVAYITFRQYY